MSELEKCQSSRGSGEAVNKLDDKECVKITMN